VGVIGLIAAVMLPAEIRSPAAQEAPQTES
jgi:hypothetical protein